MELPDRIEAKIDRSQVGQGCWIWTACKTRLGYGKSCFKGKLWGAHRLVFTLLRGDIPKGLVLDHLCRNPSCVNPDHLEPVTHGENLRRGFTRADIRHCKRGHEFTPENTRRRTNRGRPVRVCRQCEYIRGDAAWPSI